MRGLIGSLGQLFRSRDAKASERARAVGGFAKVESDFETMLAALEERIERQQSLACRTDPQSIGQDRAAEKLRRKAEAQRAMRADIEAMHARLRTGLAHADLNDISVFLRSLAEFARTGRDSHALLPRVRHAVTDRLRAEAGPMAMDRLLARLKRRSLTWPAPAHLHPGASHEAVEAARRRRIGSVRAAFVEYDLERIAERAQGIVWGWGADYPDPGSLLWRESVLVGVAAAIWGRLLQHFVELLRQDADLLLARIEELIGAKLPVLHAALDAETASTSKAQEALASSLRVLDEIIPEIGWQLVSARLPRVRVLPSIEAVDPSVPWSGMRAAETLAELPMSVPCS